MTRLDAALGRLGDLPNLNEDMRFVCRVARQAGRTRKAQIRYFKVRTTDNLREAKAAEKALDDLIGRDAEEETLFGEEGAA